ncbi:MAG: hypothetical protein SCH71_02210 [Desulfobulbaceae bacterium]|nr:hypothetical protein [Desulfobulbaceae bacterium]
MKKSLTYCLLASIFLLSFGAEPAIGMRVIFIQRLANFEGVIQSLWPRLAVDMEYTEAFTLDPRERSIRIFNEHGMEIFSLGDNVELSGATDIDMGEDGEIFVVYPRGEDRQIMRLDYKGEPLAAITLKNFPEDFQGFQPNFLQYMDNMLYLADGTSMDVAVTDTEGVFQKGYHLKAELERLKEYFEGKPGEEEFTDPERFKYIDMFGFHVDPEGSIFFTVPVLFAVFKLPVDGQITLFGTAGGARGKFGVIAGVITDRKGNIYVSDRLRSVVLIFDSSFNFITEFGLRGFRRGSLVVPDDLAIDDEKGYIYVAQAANRGVSVFRIIED